MKSFPALLSYIFLVAGVGIAVEARRVFSKSTHRSTEGMLAEKSRGINAPPLRTTPGEKTLSTTLISASHPLVLVFVQDGCPCSERLQSFLNDLYDAYEGRAEFAAVFDGDASAATRWATANHTRFMMLPDPSLELVHRYGVEYSTCVVLVGRGGKVAKMWPGYSAEMLQDLNSRLAAAVGVKRALTFFGAPSEIHPGCPY